MNLKKEDLIKMNNEMKVKDILKKLDISKPTFYKLLKDNNITLKGRAGNSGNHNKYLKINII